MSISCLRVGTFGSVHASHLINSREIEFEFQIFFDVTDGGPRRAANVFLN